MTIICIAFLFGWSVKKIKDAVMRVAKFLNLLRDKIFQSSADTSFRKKYGRLGKAYCNMARTPR